MIAIFVVNCWVNMKPLNCSQPTNLQLCSNQSTNQPQFLIWGERASKNIFAPSPIFVDRSLCSIDIDMYLPNFPVDVNMTLFSHSVPLPLKKKG